ncbi:MAG: tRNA pseudouridine(55) synthase TruB [Gemmatimonadota bacterium]|jgi:tRNA pseudouridine55 synthase
MLETDLPALLLVDKPEGPTSHDVIQVARRALGVRRVGHTGTLDPFASGLLLLCVGRSTRLAEYFHLLPKTYSATAVLGVETDTEDCTGEATASSEEWRSLGLMDIEGAAERFRGEHDQVPPAFSAKKVAGRRAYDAARAGDAIELQARTVNVHSLAIGDVRLPEVDFVAEVSTGTYVRSLARDLGRALGCGAHLSRLRRLSIGPFSVVDAVGLAELAEAAIPAGASRSAAQALSWLPIRNLSESEVSEVEQGRKIADLANYGDEDLPVAMVAGERLVSVGRRDPEGLRPEKVFHAG